VCNWSGLDNACSMVPLQRFATFGLNFWMFTCLAFCSIHESILAYKSFKCCNLYSKAKHRWHKILIDLDLSGNKLIIDWLPHFN
jgi:hypothetical protein